jgi:glycosyltransferase involved in cell wall biosynthesis
MLMSRSFRESQDPWVKVFQIWSFAWISRFLVHQGDYEIVHVHGDSLAKAGVRTAPSCHKAWIKYELSIDHSLGKVLRKRLNPLHAIILIIESYGYSRFGAKKVVAVSNSIRQQLIENYPIDPSRIQVIPPGVDVAEFAVPKAFDSQKLRRELGIPQHVPLMVFVGWEFGRKGLSTVLEAMGKVTSTESHLLVVGGGQKRSFERHAGSLGIANRVRFVGAQSDVRPYLWGSDLFVFPTRYEPFGMVIAEAMAAGLPVITSKYAGASEWIDDGVEGILLHDPYDSAELARAMDCLLLDPGRMSAMVEAARSKADVFDWDRVAEKTLELYESMLHASRTS